MVLSCNYLSIYLSISPALSVCLPINICATIYLSIYLSMELSVYLFVYQSIHPSVSLLTPPLPILHPLGPGFAIFSVIQLLLPVMALWLQRSHGEHSYWDVAAANFKHAIGLSCELVVEHVNSFIHSGETLSVLACSPASLQYCRGTPGGSFPC